MMYHGDLREPLVWRQENPVFHSSCKLELGIALQSLQGKIDLIYACVQDLVFHYWDLELTATVLLDTLATEAPSLTREQQEKLYQNVMEDYADIPLKQDRLKALRSDPHYNALQVKYGYAVTCHKAQGGQWAHVYIDQGYMTDDMLTPDYLHWLYTALTRATEKVFLVNWPETQTATEE